MLIKLEGFQYKTQLGINMGCYQIIIYDDTSELCTTKLQWGKYEYI